MADDLSALKDMFYSGRTIIPGRTPKGNYFFGYALTGRSPSSQARELVEGDKTRTIRTNVTDPKQLEKGNPALLLYPALVNIGPALLASNGAQTGLLYSTARNTGALLGTDSVYSQDVIKQAFKKPVWIYDQKNDEWIDITTYEPDNPNFTPRINGVTVNYNTALHIVKRSEEERNEEIHKFDLSSGEGRFISTYKGGNENPVLLPFEGKPIPVSINSENPHDIAESIYEAIGGGELPTDNFRVASAVMMQRNGRIDTAIINRSQRGN